MSSRLGAGERAPDFVLPSRGVPTRFYGHAGGAPTAVIFPPPGAEREVGSLLEALGEMTTVVVARRKLEGDLPARVFLDQEGTVSEAYGLSGDDGRIVLLDATLRVFRTFETDAVSFRPPLAEQVLGAAFELRQSETRRASRQAPVLLVPRALDPEVCSELMQVWARGGNQETGVELSEDRGRSDVLRSELKRRRDHTVRDQRLMEALVHTLGRRLLPEVRRVFSYPATRFEGFKIARYDAASGGFFRAHRDNLSPATAHRRFALSLNLNEGYEGGEIQFPEYGPAAYRPSAGEALLFSCSLLHEVTEVTEGERFVLLSFLFGESDVRR